MFQTPTPATGPLCRSNRYEREGMAYEELVDFYREEYATGRCEDWLDILPDPNAFMAQVTALVMDHKADEARDMLREAHEHAARWFADRA